MKSMVCVLVVAQALLAGAPGYASVEAVWKQHDLTFEYQGFTTHYSCRGLADKVESLLRYFGAREEGLKVSSYGCSAAPYRPAPAVNLKLRFATLVPAAAGTSGAVPARWVERALFPDKKIQQAAPQRITRGDCEVVERFVALVLPSFTHRTLEDLTTCVPHRLSGTVPNLREEVLVPVVPAGGVSSSPTTRP